MGRIDSLRRHCVGGSYRWSTSALRRWVVSTVCVGSVLRSVASAYIGADDRLTSAAQRFVDFSSTAASQQSASSYSRRLISNYSLESDS